MEKLFILILLLLTMQVVEAEDIYRVDTQRLNIRARPDAKSQPIGYLPHGVNVSVIDTTNINWYKVRATNGVGYVNSSFLKKVTIVDNVSDVSNYNLKVIGITAAFLLLILGIYYLYVFFSEKKDGIIEMTPNLPYQQLTIKRKSVGLAILLGLFFGPFGMFYSTIKGGFIMLLLPILTFILFMLTSVEGKDIASMVSFVGFIILLFFYFPICSIWAAIAASKTNKITINVYQSQS